MQLQTLRQLPQKTARRIRVFTDRYPWLGPLIYILSVEFFVVQLVVAGAWKLPFSLRFNTISDLGATSCGMIDGRAVCSPLHPLMNAALVVIGCLMASGSLLLYHEFRASRGSLIGFGLMGLAGVGSLGVGLFPEDVNFHLHILSASLPFILGNFSLIVLALAIDNISPVIRWYTVLSGTVALVALLFFITHHYGMLGEGGLERVVAYPQTIWLILFGLYMTRNRFAYYRALRRTAQQRWHM